MTSEKRWAVVRIVLGNVQMAGGAATLVLLLTVGPTRPTIAVAAVTGAVLLVSIYLFRVRRPPRGHDEGK